MNQGKKKCDVCNNEITLKKKEIYSVYVSSFPQPIKIYNAIDCPFCGCQTLLKLRYPKKNDVEQERKIKWKD